MALFTLGCQTYTWEMLGPDWQGTPEEILDAIAAAGYSGVEFSNVMIGPYLDAPQAFQHALEARGLRCAGFAYARQGFSDPAEYENDLAGAEKALRFADYFSVVLGLGGPSSNTRQDYEAKIEQAVSFYQEVARRAQLRGIQLAVHPHSHFTSLVLNAAEYDHLLSRIEPLGIRFNPDTGHILRGGQDLMDCLGRYRSLISHVHVKDVDREGRWTGMGRGITPVSQLFGWLEETGYAGWVVIEEESDEARQDPAAAVSANRRFLRSIGY